MKMKKTFFTQIFVLAALISFGQSGFEGELVMETTTAKTNEKATVTVLLKGQSTRMEISSSTPDYSIDYAIVVDASGASMISEGVVTDLESDKFNKAPDPSMKLVGTTEGVSKNGYETVHYQFSDGEATVDYWVADQFPVSYQQLPQMFRSGLPLPEGGLTGLPVAMEMKNADGSPRSTQKLISVAEKPVSDSVFKRQ